MNLKPIKQNMTELHLEVKRGAFANVLFSYQTPVAYQWSGDDMVYVTDKFWSRTTSRHINEWLGTNYASHAVEKVPQSQIDNLVASVEKGV